MPQTVRHVKFISISKSGIIWLSELPARLEGPIPGYSRIKKYFPKSTGGEQPGRIFLNSLVYVCVYVFIYLCIYLFVCVTSLGHTNNDTDLKFGTHTPIDLI